MVPAFSQSNDCDTLENCKAAINVNQRNSLAHYRMGEILFQKQDPSDCKIEHDVLGAAHAIGCENYLLAMNEFLSAISGDLQPRWTEVWAHIYLGKIWDITEARDLALNEYRLARRTKDNTRGAQEEAAKYTESPFRRAPAN
jgi:hypothetical protein